MKNALPALAVTFLSLLGALTLVAILSRLAGCTSPEQQTAAQALAEEVTAATKDGVVTQDEADAIQVKMKAYADAPGTDWTQVISQGIGTVAASLTAGFFGLRYLPNRHIVGQTEALALDKAAGTPP